MLYLLDTDTWSYFLKGQRGVARAIGQRPNDELAICRVSLAELEVWAHRVRSARRLEQVRALADSVRFLEVDSATWHAYPIVATEMRRRGRKVGMADLLIGCCARIHGATIVTNNVRHFTHVCDVTGVPLENWSEPDERD